MRRLVRLSYLEEEEEEEGCWGQGVRQRKAEEGWGMVEDVVRS